MNLRETVADFLTRGSLSQLREQVSSERQGTQHFKERLHELESGLNQWGWELISDSGATNDFSREAHRLINRLARLMFLKNPLLQRGVNVQTDYVFGQGLTIHAPDANVDRVLQEFWDDLQNKAELTEIEALQDKEREQQILGETFFVFFTNKLTGRVRVRTFDPDEIDDVLSNPEDSKEPWFYKRTWNATRLDYATGQTASEPRTAYYPDWNYNPTSKPSTIGGSPVLWDVPVYHVKSGGLRRMKRGISEVYSQLDWAKAYTEFLENRATVAKALSRFVLKFKAKTRAGVAAVQNKLASTLSGSPYQGASNLERNPAPSAGSAAVMADGRDVEAMSVKGATIHPDEGRRFLLMVACGAGLPETFYGDASVGTLATAQSLDRPTELMMEKRRAFWTTVLINIALYVVRRAIEAPGNRLKGAVTYLDNTPVIKIDGLTVEIAVDFPPLLEHDVQKQMSAVAQANALIPAPELMARQAMKAIGVKNIDDEISKIDFAKIEADKEKAAQAANSQADKTSTRPAAK